MPKFASEKDRVKYLEVILALRGEKETGVYPECGAGESSYGPHGVDQGLWVAHETRKTTLCVVKPCSNHLKLYLEHGCKPFYNEDQEENL